MLYKIQHKIVAEDASHLNEISLLTEVLKNSLAKGIVEQVPVEFKDVSHPKDKDYLFEARIGVLTEKEYNYLSKVIANILRNPNTGYLLEGMEDNAPEFLKEIKSRMRG